MANLLTIEKLDNDLFSFIVNGDTLSEVQNLRNDLLVVGELCHFKTANGANIIKEQNINFANITIIDGVIITTPTSTTNLFDTLTALSFFDWFKSTGTGVNRFEDLLDGFEFFGKANQFVIVSGDELQLTTTTFTPITASIGLSDMPNALVAGKILKINNTATAYELVDPPAGANGLKQQFTYVTGDPQDFTLATSSDLSAVFWNGALLDDGDWLQSLNILTILFPLDDGAKIKPIGQL